MEIRVLRNILLTQLKGELFVIPPRNEMKHGIRGLITP